MCIYFTTLTLNMPLLVNNVFVDLNDDLKEFQNGGVQIFSKTNEYDLFNLV